ncbi:hypothetical protein FGO68_gene2858 [Halteria grandinella]|uniref:Secreted protein n=1 Tax=Halteria grandinella TaxID=5974 RepID=A0A8J8NE65_HALGN|nr:hypothetical protein FGO68_gene2858 [Halteria grandinella]
MHWHVLVLLQSLEIFLLQASRVCFQHLLVKVRGLRGLLHILSIRHILLWLGDIIQRQSALYLGGWWGPLTIPKRKDRIVQLTICLGFFRSEQFQINCLPAEVVLAVISHNYE